MKNYWKTIRCGIEAALVTSLIGSLVTSLFIFVVLVATKNPYLMYTSTVFYFLEAAWSSLLILFVPALLVGVALAFRLRGQGFTFKRTVLEGSIGGGVLGFLIALSDVIFIYQLNYYLALRIGLFSLLGAGMGAIGAGWLFRRLMKIV